MNIYKDTTLWQYLAAQMITGPMRLTMAGCENEPMKDHKGNDITKPVLYFQETKKGLVLNKTNAARIAKAYGPDTDEWGGRKVELYTEPVAAFGKTTEAIRVRIADPLAQVAPQPELVTVDEAANNYAMEEA